MRKIDLASYTITEEIPGGKPITAPYNVKQAIMLMLYHPELRLTSKALLDNDRLAQKIEKADGTVLLEEEEYDRVKKAFETVHGFSKNDVELVRRVMEAPQVGVKETP